MSARAAGLALALLAANALPVQAAGDPPDPRRILHLMSYVSKDYAEAAHEKEEDELAEQRGFLKEALRQVALLKPRKQRAAIQAGIAAALELVTKVAPADQVTHQLEQVAAGLLHAYECRLHAPEHVDLAAGKALYVKACATCHGVDGKADAPAVAEMKPKPIRFTDAEKMARLSPAQVQDTIAYGVTGTPMPSFESVFRPKDRWNMAFYVFTLRGDAAAPEALPKRRLPTRELAKLTDAQLEEMLRGQRVPAEKLAGARQALRNAGGKGARH